MKTCKRRLGHFAARVPVPSARGYLLRLPLMMEGKMYGYVLLLSDVLELAQMVDQAPTYWSLANLQ